MGSGFLTIGVSGLNAANIGLMTTGHNISNASTPGFNRQVIVQGTNIPILTGAGFLGQGTHVQTVQRVYNQYLARQVLSAEAGAAEMDGYLTQIKQIDNLLADPSAGLSPAMADFFKGVQEVAANPSSIPGRQSMLSAAQSVVARFQALDQRLSELRQGVNSQISDEISIINSYASQIAEINQRIIIARSSTTNQEPNDLLDQRDQMIKDLNQHIRVSALTQGDGSFSVFIGNGQPLVVGTDSFKLVSVAADDDPERLVVAMQGSGGATLALPESQVTGGTLGGLVSFRSQTLDAAQNGLGRIAVTLAQNFNDQHRLGMDLTGALGGDFFNVGSPAVIADINNLSAGTAKPAVTLDPATIEDLTVSDYRLSYVGGATPYQLTRLADGLVRSYAALPQTVDGMTIDVGTWATPQVTDSFMIQPTRHGASDISVAVTDPRNIAAAAPVRTSAALTNNGTGAIDAGTVVDTTNAAFTTTPGSLTPPILIRFDTAATYTVYDNSNPLAPVALEGPIAYNPGQPVFPTPGSVLPPSPPLDFGCRVTLSGAPVAGDEFSIEWNSNGVSDNRNAMLLGALQTATTMAGGTASYQSAYSQIVSAVGTKAREVQTVGEAQQGLADRANEAMQQMSGVNLDEEAANLLRYQQAYQASARLIDIAGRLFDTLLSIR